MAQEFWTVQRRDELVIRTWSDGSVVFDDANAQLQCLSPVSGELFTLLMKCTQSTSKALAEELLGEVPTLDDVQMVENALAEFSTLNLIERVTR